MKIAIIIPTYNERGNIQKIVEQILRLNIPGYIIIVDDNSPDGTGELADQLAQKYSSLRVLHRPQKQGLGRAYTYAIKYALGFDIDGVITMDADLSHSPNDVPRLVDASKDCDVVIGSRYVDGGKTTSWEAWRRWMSLSGMTISRFILGIKTRDCTAGFKFYKRRFLESLDLNAVASGGYAFQVEMIFRAEKCGFKVSEIPITFYGREHGESKVDFGVMLSFGKEQGFLSLRRRLRLGCCCR